MDPPFLSALTTDVLGPGNGYLELDASFGTNDKAARKDVVGNVVPIEDEER